MIPTKEQPTMTPEPVDFRFDIQKNPEPDQASDLYTVTMIALVVAPADEQWPVDTLIDGEVVERFNTDDPGAAIEAFRETQAFTLEDRLGEFGLEWQREQRAALGLSA